MTRLGAVFLTTLWLGVTSTSAMQDELRVLFIGNSLTAFNDLPKLVEQLTEEGGKRIRTTTIARNDFSLDDHWIQSSTVGTIMSGKWSFVVLQQGPSALPESRMQLRVATRRFDQAIRMTGARTALYMVWPSEARAGDFDAVRESYALAAADVGGVFLPAGEAWRAAWRRDPRMELYAPDRFHPTHQGSMAAALVIAQILSGRDVMPAPAIDGGTILRDAAAEVVSRHRVGGRQGGEAQDLRRRQAWALIGRHVTKPLM